MKRNVNWCLIALAAVYAAAGIITIIQPYSERTIFVAVASSFTAALILSVMGLKGT